MVAIVAVAAATVVAKVAVTVIAALVEVEE